MTDSMTVLGWTLVHFCWQAAVIALVYRGVDLVLAKSRSHVRYGLALVALMTMLGVAIGTLVYEGRQVVHHDASLRGTFAVLPAEFQGNVAAQPTRDGTTAAQPRAHMSFVGFLVSAMPWLDAMWLAGVVILSVRTAGGWYVIRKLRRSGLVQVPAEVSAMLIRLTKRIGIKRRIDLYISERVSGPLAMGVLRSVILLPISALTHLSPGQLEVVLAHELAHIRRGDYLWNMVQTIVETLFFFHPAVWWVSGHLRQQRELCCDDAALAYCSDPVVYATALLCLEEQRGSKLRLAMALDGHRSGLKARIVRILGEAPERRRQITPLSLVGVCAMLGLFILPLPRLLADHVVAAPEPIQSAAVIEPKLTHIAGQATPSTPAGSSEPVSPPARVAAPAAVAQPVLAPSPLPKAARVSAAPRPAAEPVPAVSPSPGPNPIPAVAPHVTISSRVFEQMGGAPALAVAHMTRAYAIAPAMAMFVLQQQNSDSPPTRSDYISEMRAAGYGDDLDKLIEMKIHHITPEYARSMEQLGYGKPSAQELIELKIFGVTPDTAKSLTASGLKPSTLRDLIQYQIFKVTPEFVSQMKAAGFSDIPPSRLVELKVHGITPEFAKAAKAQYPDITLNQLIQLRIFHIDEAFIASAKRHGFNQLTIDKLVKLRISGLLDDSDQKAEKN